MGVIKEKNKGTWKTVDMLIYDSGPEQNQKWPPCANRIKYNLLGS